MSLIRRSLGICPQFDILWPDITVREHLVLYALIKGDSWAEAGRQAEQAAVEVRPLPLGQQGSAVNPRKGTFAWHAQVTLPCTQSVYLGMCMNAINGKDKVGFQMCTAFNCIPQAVMQSWAAGGMEVSTI